MDDVAKYPGLMQRGTKWYLRRSVPKDLQQVIGKKQIWRTLNTGDYKVAKPRYVQELAKVERQFAAARNGPPPIDGEDARQAVADWLASYDRALAKADFNTHGPGRRGALDGARDDLATVTHGDDEEVLGPVQAVVDEILITLGWPWEHHEIGPVKTGQRLAKVDKGGKGYWDLCDLVRRAMAEAARRRVERLGGPRGVLDPVFVNGTTQAPIVPDGKVVTLGELTDRYLGDPGRTRTTGKTSLDYGFAFRLLHEILGRDTDVRTVTRADCRKVRDLVAALPANASKKWPGVPLAEVARRARRDGTAPMAPRTANSYLHKLSALFRWAEREEYVDRNPGVGLRVAEPDVHQREARRPFSLDQLRKMFDAPLYCGCKDDGHGYAVPGPNVPRGWRFWLLPVGLFSGLRLNEICSLRVADLETIDGVPCFVVRPDPERGRLKTKAAARTVPVHPELIKMGLLDHATQTAARGEQMLFPGIKVDTRGYRSDHAQKWFARFMEKAGAEAPRTSFHSTRHCFRDALREADIGRDAVLALGGWSTGGTEEIYGGGLRASTLSREIAKVQYPDMDLSHLRSDNDP